jgi:murein DD-endopeptidase MepM/ murein hydrolase activator NlpD
MPSVGTAYVNVRVSTKGFERSLDNLMKRLSTKMESAGTQLGKDFERGLNKTNPYKTLEERSSKATTSIVNNHRKIDDSSDRMATNMADGADLASRHVEDLARNLDTARGSMGKLGQSTSNARRSLLSLGGASGRSGGGFRSSGGDVGFFRGKLNELVSEAPSGIKILNRLHDAAAFAGTGAAGAIGGLAAAAQGIFVVGSNAAAAAPALAVMANGMMSLGQVGGVMALAMKGVGGAITAGFKSADAATKGTTAAAETSAKAIQAAARGVRDAKDALQDAYRAAARAAEDAARRTADAERTLAAAQVKTTQVQKGLNAARAEAIEQMQDIAFAAEDASLAEDRAALSLADAHQALLAVSELAPDDRARVEAELAYKEADLQMREAVDRRQDADKEQKESVKKGRNGTQAMVEYHEEVADAQQAEAEAGRDLADARREEAETAIDNADRIAEAQQNVADAQKALADAQRDSTKATDAATTAADEFRTAMEKLGPEQQKFVRRILRMRTGFQEFSNKINEPLFERLNTALDVVNQKGKDGKSIQDVLTTGLQGTAEALGDTAIKAAELANNDIFQQQLGDAMDYNNEAIGNFGSAAVNLSEAFVAVADAAGPLFVDFSEWVESITGTWADDASGDIDGMRTKIETAGTRVKEFYGFFKELWGWLRRVGTQANNAANAFKWTDKKGNKRTGYIPALTDSLKEFNKALDKPKNKDKMFDDFTQSLNTLSAAGRALKNAFIDPLLTLASDPDLETAFNTIAESPAFDKLAATAGDAVPELATLVVNVADFLAEISESGSLDTFLAVLGGIAGTLADIAGWLSDIKLPGWLTDMINKFGDWSAKLSGLPFLGFLENMDKLDSKGTSVLKVIGLVAGSVSALALAWKLIKIGSSPFVKLYDGAKRFGTAIADMPRKMNNLRKSFANIGTRFTNLFRAPDAKKDLRTKTAKPTKVASSDAAGEAASRTAGERIGLAYAEGLKIGQAEVKIQMEAMEASLKTNLTTMATTLTIEGEAVGLHIMQGISEGITVGKIDTLNDARVAGAAIIDAVKNGAGIASPPPEMIKAGGDIMEGLEIGIKEGQVEATVTGKTAGAAVSQSVVQGTQGAQASLVAAGNDIGDGVTTGVAGGIDKGTKGGKIGGSLGRMGKVFSGASKVMGGAMRGLGGAMNFMMGPWGMLIMILLPLLMPLLKKLNDKFHITDKIMAGLKWTLDKLGDAFTWLWEKIKDLFGWVKKNWPTLLAILTGPIGLAVLVITKNWDKIKEIVTGAVDAVKKVLGKIWDGITAGWSKVSTFFANLWADKIKPYIVNIINKARALLLGIWNGIRAGWAVIGTWISNLWKDKIKPKIVNLIARVRTFLMTIWNGIKAGWTAIGTWLGNMWRDRVRPKVVNLITSATTKLKTIWQGIKDGWANIKTWLDGLWGSISGKISTFVTNFTTGISGIWNGLKSGFKGVYNTVADLVNDYLIDGLNNILGVFHIKTTIDDMPKIGKLAEGGFVRGPGGPKEDRILTRLSNGEFVVPAKQARMLGPKTLEHIRKTGQLPEGKGGILGYFKDKYDSVKDAIKSGAAAAFRWVLSKFKDKLGSTDGNIVKQISLGVLEFASTKIVGLGKKKDKEAAESTAGYTAYTGPPGGWINPLGSKGVYIITTRPGHGGHSGVDANAVDLATFGGLAKPIYAVSAGKVVKSGWGGNYGNMVQILHKSGETSLYAHMKSPSRLRYGQVVKTGTFIGNVGSTGNSTGPHLHFELDPNTDSYAAMIRHGVTLGKGGVVAPSPAGTMALLAEAGHHERVTPLDAEGFTPAERRMLEALESSLGGGGGGDTYHVHPTPGMNETALADLVMRRAAWKRRRGGGRR